MMRELYLRPMAKAAIEAIAVRIAQDNLSASIRFTERVQETLNRVLFWPLCGAELRIRIAKLRGLRSYPIRGYRNYIVYYLPRQDGIDVVHVIHGARNLRKVLRSA